MMNILKNGKEIKYTWTLFISKRSFDVNEHFSIFLNMCMKNTQALFIREKECWTYMCTNQAIVRIVNSEELRDWVEMLYSLQREY